MTPVKLAGVIALLAPGQGAQTPGFLSPWLAESSFADRLNWLSAVSGLDLDRVLFEAVSAFGTVGLSTGITAALPPAGQYILIALMFIGRIGPITMASALALKERHKLYRLPEERPIVG